MLSFNRRGFEEKLNEMEAAAERLTSQRNTEAANDRLTIMKLREELAENRFRFKKLDYLRAFTLKLISFSSIPRLE